MSYEILIKEKRQVKKLVGKEWQVIGEKEVEREQRLYSLNKEEPKTRMDSVYGYTPEIEKTVIEEQEILKQTVEILNLAKVIKAINGL
jgi:hypothetical protein